MRVSDERLSDLVSWFEQMDRKWLGGRGRGTPEVDTLSALRELRERREKEKTKNQILATQS